LLDIEKATAINEVMVASSVSVAHSAPDQTSENDEGFVEPKHHFFKKKDTYEVSTSIYLYFLGIINISVDQYPNPLKKTEKITKSAPKNVSFNWLHSSAKHAK